MWNRDLFSAALSYEAIKDKTYAFKTRDNFKTIYIGHTSTLYWGSEYPIKAANIVNVDIGCGKGAYPLSMIDLNTNEIFQSYK